MVEFTAKAKKQDICEGAGEGGGEVEIYLLWILNYSIQEKHRVLDWSESSL